MIAKDESDGLAKRLGVRAPGEAWRFGVIEAEIADEAAHQHPEQGLFASADRIMLDNELTILEDAIRNSRKLSFRDQGHVFD